MLAKCLNTFAKKNNLSPILQFGFCKGLDACDVLLTITNFFFFFFMNGNTERAQCALSLVCIPQEMEKSKTSL